MGLGWFTAHILRRHFLLSLRRGDEQSANGGEKTIITGDDMTSVEGQIYVDASDWNTWTYINLEALANASLNGKTDVANAVCVMDIPTQAIDADTETGIYTYWFDVFGQGLTNNERRLFCSDKGIVTSFAQKGKNREASTSVSMVKKGLARVRATAMEGSFGTQK